MLATFCQLRIRAISRGRRRLTLPSQLPPPTPPPSSPSHSVRTTPAWIAHSMHASWVDQMHGYRLKFGLCKSCHLSHLCPQSRGVLCSARHGADDNNSISPLYGPRPREEQGPSHSCWHHSHLIPDAALILVDRFSSLPSTPQVTWEPPPWVVYGIRRGVIGTTRQATTADDQ